MELESVLAGKLGNGLELRMGTSKLSWEDFPEPREAVVIGQVVLGCQVWTGRSDGGHWLTHGFSRHMRFRALQSLVWLLAWY